VLVDFRVDAGPLQPGRDCSLLFQVAAPSRVSLRFDELRSTKEYCVGPVALRCMYASRSYVALERRSSPKLRRGAEGRHSQGSEKPAAAVQWHKAPRVFRT